MEFQIVLSPPGSERLRKLRTSYGLELPQDFLDFIERYNGGVPSRTVTFDGGGNVRVVERFLPLLGNPGTQGLDGQYDCVVVIKQIEDRLFDDPDGDGAEVLPIAALFGGDFVCLDFRHDSHCPSVVVWDHEASRKTHAR